MNQYHFWKDPRFLPLTGQALVIVGSVLSTLGALINNITLDHTLAMHIWQYSNFLLLAWAVGFYKKYWSNGLGIIALITMYLVFFISNEAGLYLV